MDYSNLIHHICYRHNPTGLRSSMIDATTEKASRIGQISTGSYVCSSLRTKTLFAERIMSTNHNTKFCIQLSKVMAREGRSNRHFSYDDCC